MSIFRRLRYFVAVAEELNFHRAAERLHITQPALWRQMRELERDAGAQLLLREPSGIGLTKAGRGYLDDTRRILQLLDEANNRAQRVERGQVGVLRIAFNEIAARAGCLPQFFQAFRTRFPDIDLQLSVMMSQMQLEALSRCDIDAGFLFHRPEANPVLDYRSILDDDHLIAIPRGHRLADAASLRLHDLADERFIMPSPILNRALHVRLMSACMAGGLTPNVVQHADNEHTLLSMVAVGMGVAFVNTSRSARHTREVVYRQIEGFSVPVTLDLVWQRDNLSTPLANFVALIGTLRAEGPLRWTIPPAINGTSAPHPPQGSTR